MALNKKELTAEGMKNELWENMLKVKSKEISPEMANSIASQSREIMRIVRTEILISQLKPTAKIKNILG